MEKIKLTKSQKILFIVLAIVLAYAIFDFLTHKDTYLGFYSGQRNETVMADSAAQNAQRDTVGDLLKTNLTKIWGDDPFFIKEKKKPKRYKRTVRKEVNFKLRAISFRPEGSVALINSRIVKAGDIIEGYKVIKISENTVVLWNGRNRKVLKLKNM